MVFEKLCRLLISTFVSEIFQIFPMDIELQPGETKINTWSILYYPPGGGKYTGKLTVTNRRLLYDTPGGGAGKGLIPETIFVKWGSSGYLEFEKSDIVLVEVTKNFLNKKAVLTLTDGSKHVFKHGVLNINKVVEAINRNRNN